MSAVEILIVHTYLEINSLLSIITDLKGLVRTATIMSIEFLVINKHTERREERTDEGERRDVHLCCFQLVATISESQGGRSAS